MVNNLERVRDLVARKRREYNAVKVREYWRLVSELKAGRIDDQQFNQAFKDFCNNLVFTLD